MGLYAVIIVDSNFKVPDPESAVGVHRCGDENCV